MSIDYTAGWYNDMLLEAEKHRWWQGIAGFMIFPNYMGLPYFLLAVIPFLVFSLMMSSFLIAGLLTLIVLTGFLLYGLFQNFFEILRVYDYIVMWIFNSPML